MGDAFRLLSPVWFARPRLGTLIFTFGPRRAGDWPHIGSIVSFGCKTQGE